MSAVKSILATLAILSVAACDRALTKITNTTQGPLVLRYWHVNYDRWSPIIPFEPETRMNLVRGHHFAEIRCLEISEGPRHYRYDPAALAGMHAVCDHAFSCDLTYLGKGALRATRSMLDRLAAPGDKTIPAPEKSCW
jgi:hypothetical protein